MHHKNSTNKNRINNWKVHPRDLWDFNRDCRNKERKYDTVSGTTTIYYCKASKCFDCTAKLRIDFDHHGTMDGVASLNDHAEECNRCFESRHLITSVFSSFDLRRKVEQVCSNLCKRLSACSIFSL